MNLKFFLSLAIVLPLTFIACDITDKPVVPDSGQTNQPGGDTGDNTEGETPGEDTGGTPGGDAEGTPGGETEGNPGGETGDVDKPNELPELPAGVERVTVEEFLRKDVSDVIQYGLTGTIEDISDSQKGNFYLTDETGSVYVYGLTRTQLPYNDKSFSSLGLKEGDIVTIVGYRFYYQKDDLDEVKGAYYVSSNSTGVTPDPDIPTTPESPSNPDATITASWLELPAMPEDSGLEYYYHDFSMNGKKYRNYSFGWSQKDYVALWVAYPMCSMYTKKTVGRTNAWAYDPKLGSSKSSAPFGGYGGSYSRGHQVASSDRLCCTEANKQTFYGTNMTPQLQDLNGVKWQHLENGIQALCAAVDTVYVVTGCIVEGNKESVKDSDGNMMTVPTGYYKALLSYDASSPTGTWLCSAFYFEHRKYDSKISLQTVALSVDALEEKTGIDFFPYLKEKIGEAEAEKLESQDPKNFTFLWSYIK